LFYTGKGQFGKNALEDGGLNHGERFGAGNDEE